MRKEPLYSIIKKLESEEPVSYVVEYFPSIDKETAYKEALAIYKKVFSLTPKKEEIEFVQDEDLEGGIKVYKDDLMVDISYSKYKNFLKR